MSSVRLQSRFLGHSAMALAMAGALFAPGAPAAPVRGRYAGVELAAGHASVRPGRPFWVACRIDLDAGWHTYWKNPGDAGLAPKVTWTLPAGFRAGPIVFPFPERFEEEGIVSFGYAGRAVLLTEITPPADLAPAGEVRLAARVEILVCKDVCVPESAEVELSLPVRDERPRADPAQAPLLAEARARVPKAGDWAMRARRDGKAIALTLTPPAGAERRIEKVAFFPEAQNLVDYAQPVSWREADGSYSLTIPLSPLARKAPDRLVGALVSEDGWSGAGTERALQVDLPLE